MLTRDLIRCRAVAGELKPYLLKPTPAVRDLAERLCAHWRGAVGRTRAEIDDAGREILHSAQSLVMARGLDKVLDDAAGFTDPASAEALRERAFDVSAAALAKPPATAAEHATTVAAGLGEADLSARLYADLPDAAVLTTAPPYTADGLIAHYNLALCQGLLLGARELRLTVADSDRGLHRRLCAALRHRRLLALAEPADGGGLRLTISGPAALVDGRVGYGLQFALLLPAICCARRWQAEADIVPPRGGEAALLRLDDRLDLPGDQRSLEHVPPELAAWLELLAAKLDGWRPAAAEPLILPGGELVLPDLALMPAGGGTPVTVELFHRWHRNALARRLDQLAAGQLTHHLLGVDRALAKLADAKPLLERPAFAAHGFLFSDLPSPRALNEALNR